MTDRQVSEYLIGVVIICALGAMFNLSKLKTRGQSAKYLAGAFCSLGVAVYLVKLGANQLLVAAAGAVTFGLLAADFVYRLAKHPGVKSK